MTRYEKLKERWNDCQTWFANLLSKWLVVAFAVIAPIVQIGQFIGALDDSLITPVTKIKILAIVGILAIIGKYLPPPAKKKDMDLIFPN